MPLTNLFLWLILLLSGFIIAALLSAQFRAEQRARRELIHLSLHRDSSRCSRQFHSFSRTSDVLSDKHLKPQTAFLTVEHKPATDSGRPAVSFDWPRADRAVIEHSKQLDHPAESDQHNCA